MLRQHASDQGAWQNALQQIQPDGIAWIREEALDPLLVSEYRDALHALGMPVRLESQLIGGEGLKAWDVLPTLLDMFESSGLSRRSLVITTGGGALSDAVGFAASVWKRGMPVAHIPTTTLAAVDAAWGGKTGMNWGEVKNQVGTFHPPTFVHVDSRWMRTLSPREFQAGLAEAAKHAMIDAHVNLSPTPSYADLVQGAGSSVDAWNTWLEQSAAVKMRVVAQDPQEQGLRSVLNLGHTLGHALESACLSTSTPLLHGEAVAMGLAFALWEAEHPALCEEQLTPDAAQEAATFRAWLNHQIPVSRTDWPAAGVLWAFMMQDKKNVGNEVRDVAWRGTGRLVWPASWKKAAFEATWHDFLRCWNEPSPPSDP
ncbi:MAG: 3-dehydroquinate synthase [Bacteroidetes bacterium]|nr:3-dehydroquinate synthase [Bacteroidota bacterium]